MTNSLSRVAYVHSRGSQALKESKVMTPSCNSRKRITLAVFERYGGWLSPAMVAGLTGFRPIRAAWSYLRRLNRWGLLYRRRGAGGLVLYRISAKGRERLAWLREHSE